MRGIFAKILAGIPKEDLIFDDLSFAISQQICGVLKRRGLSQKELAILLGCSEAAVSKNLSGDANLTLKTIAKILSALSAEMKVAVFDTGTNVFLHKAFKNTEWEKEPMKPENQECFDVQPLAA